MEKEILKDEILRQQEEISEKIIKEEEEEKKVLEAKESENQIKLIQQGENQSNDKTLFIQYLWISILVLWGLYVTFLM